MKYTKENIKVWNILFERQLENVHNHACSIYLEGFKSLNLNSKSIPSTEEINKKLKTKSDWEIVNTKVRYMSTLSWYQHLARREFIMTGFLRDMKELDFTPEPDIFHDIFGHMPFLMIPEYLKLLELFAPAYFSAQTDGQRESVKRLAWFSYEFGLIREKGELKIFGAGIISSKGELERVMRGEIPILEFTIENVVPTKKAIFNYNDKLFIANSFEDLLNTLKDYFSTFQGFDELYKLSKQDYLQRFPKVEDTEMTY